MVWEPESLRRARNAYEVLERAAESFQNEEGDKEAQAARMKAAEQLIATNSQLAVAEALCVIGDAILKRLEEMTVELRRIK